MNKGQTKEEEMFSCAETCRKTEILTVSMCVSQVKSANESANQSVSDNFTFELQSQGFNFPFLLSRSGDEEGGA